MRARSADVESVLAASRGLLAVVARSMADVLDQVSLPQYRALVVLYVHGPTRVGLLADQLSVHQSTITRTLDKLVDSGLVVRATSQTSRREVLVELSVAGSDLVATVMKRRRQELATALNRMSAADRAAVLTGMELLADALGEPTLSESLVLPS